jgi:low temperature requirement protein LtrA
MRLAMVSLWLRAAYSDPEGRTVALRYAIGIAAIQVAWVVWLFLPSDARVPVFVLLAVGEVTVPVWAERAGRTSWNPGHMAERYGLFTIIVLGEALLAASRGVQVALDGRTNFGTIAGVVVGGLLIVFSMWWFHFDMPSEQIVEEIRAAFQERSRGAFTWGYGHYVVYASAAAVGVGITVALDQKTHHSHLTQLQSGLVITVAVTLYLVVVWALHAPYKPPSWLRNYPVPVAAVLILASSATPEPVLATGVVMAALIAVGVFANRTA